MDTQCLNVVIKTKTINEWMKYDSSEKLVYNEQNTTKCVKNVNIN